MEAPAESVGAETTFFEEKDVVLSLIKSILGGDSAFDRCFSLLEQHLSKYQGKNLCAHDKTSTTNNKHQTTTEQPNLLAPHMHDLVDPLNDCLLGIVGTIDRSSYSKKNNLHSSNDPQEFENLHNLCKTIQLICRVRGFKHVIKLFPHEVEHLEPCLILLQSQNQRDYIHWETRYVLLLWLSILCLIPFDICSIDSTINRVSTTNMALESLGRSNFVGDALEIATTYLSDTGPPRDAASICLSALLTRPDMEVNYLNEFVSWARGVLNAWSEKSSEEIKDLTPDSFRIIGVLHCLAQIFKRGHRYKLLPFCASILRPCVAISGTDIQMISRQLLTKLLQRMGMTYLPPIIAVWRYQRGKRSLHDNLHNLKASTNTEAQEGPWKEQEQEQEEEVDLPSEVEEIIG